MHTRNGQTTTVFLSFLITWERERKVLGLYKSAEWCVYVSLMPLADRLPTFLISRSFFFCANIFSIYNIYQTISKMRRQRENLDHKHASRKLHFSFSDQSKWYMFWDNTKWISVRKKFKISSVSSLNVWMRKRFLMNSHDQRRQVMKFLFFLSIFVHVHSHSKLVSHKKYVLVSTQVKSTHRMNDRCSQQPSKSLTRSFVNWKIKRFVKMIQND